MYIHWKGMKAFHFSMIYDYDHLEHHKLIIHLISSVILQVDYQVNDGYNHLTSWCLYLWFSLAQVVCESPLLTGRVVARLAEDLSARKTALSPLGELVARSHKKIHGENPSKP